MATKKKASAASVPGPDKFFARELAGDEPPSFATLLELYNRAMALFTLKPWDHLSDSELIVIEDPISARRGYCCVMGALGEVLTMHVFLGTEGFRVFDAIQSRDPNVTEWIYGEAASLSVELVGRKELQPQDRALLQAAGHPAKPGLPVPRFRSQRKGYLPWFVDEAEAKLLTHCERAVTWMVHHVSQSSGAKYWDHAGQLPLVVPSGPEGEYAIQMVSAPDPSKLPIATPAWDPKRVQAILRAAHPTPEIVEVDHFFLNSMVGGKYDRKAILGMSLVIDAATAIVLAPEMGEPGAAAGDLMVEGLLKAIETTKSIPKEVHVRDIHKKAELSPLARELGFVLRAASSMPALDFAKSELQQMMGG